MPLPSEMGPERKKIGNNYRAFFPLFESYHVSSLLMVIQSATIMNLALPFISKAEAHVLGPINNERVCV